MARNRILIIEDEPGIRFGMRDFLEAHGFTVDEVEDCQAALKHFKNNQPDAVVLDYMLPDGNALELLPRLKQIDSDMPVVILTGHGSIDLAVRAVKEGAEQFLTKPIELPALLVVLERALENRRNRQKQLAGKSQQERRIAIDPFRGTSALIRALGEQARRVLATDSPILIQGETGTGKGVLARWLHHNGPRHEEAFIDLNCAGLTRELLETELFGHEKGAFTGATASKTGLFEVAHGGTIFLDEIGDVDPQIQPKLLKVIEEIRERLVDVRLIAATHQDLTALIREQRFRRDLYYRISTIPLEVPPLRHRAEDIPTLARYLLQESATDIGRGEVGLAPDLEKALQNYSWPGNIRELRNVLERALLLSDHAVLERKDVHLSNSFETEGRFDEANLTLAELERRHIERVLGEERGQVVKAAERLGIPRSSLYEKIKKYGIIASRI
jgi:DNA-binding NtrC family response regulator